MWGNWQCPVVQFPRHCRMFMAHLHRWALAFLGSGFGGSSVNAAESAPRQPASLPNGIASLQGPSAGALGRVTDLAVAVAGKGKARSAPATALTTAARREGHQRPLIAPGAARHSGSPSAQREPVGHWHALWRGHRSGSRPAQGRRRCQRRDCNQHAERRDRHPRSAGYSARAPRARQRSHGAGKCERAIRANTKRRGASKPLVHPSSEKNGCSRCFR